MSVKGKWHVVEIPDYDMALSGAYILFGKSGGEFAFDCLRLNRVVSFTVPANTASWGLMERLGMQKLGEFDHPSLPEGHSPRRHAVYEIAAPSRPSSET